MAFVERTDWVNSPKPPPKPGETPVRAADIKRWERGIAAAHEELEGRLSEEGIDERVRAVGDGTYAPHDNIPKASLAASVQGSLSKAETAAQPYFDTDRILYVSPGGSSSNHGRAPGAPKLYVQDALDTLAALGGGVVYMAAAEFTEHIRLNSLVSLLGPGGSRAAFKAPPGSTRKGVIEMSAGPVTGAHCAGFSVRPNGNAGQHGIYLEARGVPGDPNNNGGFWYSSFDDVRVGQFAGDSWWFRGGGIDTLKPHQFLELRNCFGVSGNSGAALRMSGQCGQIRVAGGNFDGPSQGAPSSHAAIVVQREVNDDYSNKSAQGGYTIDFEGTTIQSNNLGVTVDGGRSIVFDNPYFENLNYGMDITNSPLGVIVNNPMWANAVSKITSDGSGYAIRQRGSRVDVYDPVIVGRWDGKAMDSDQSAGSLNVHGTAKYPSMIGNPSTGMTRQSTIASDGSLQIDGVRTLLVNGGSPYTLRTLNGYLSVGQEVTLRAYGGSFTIAAGGNISPSGNSFPITVQNGQTISFVRMDLVTVWTMKSFSGGSLPIESNAPPAVIPSFNGQQFRDLTNKKKYEAFGTASVDDWVALN
jgi:hypothetical protein